VTPEPQLPEAYVGTSDNLDFNAQCFAGSSATDFLTGLTDTEVPVNFDWVGSDQSNIFQWPGLALTIRQELWDNQFQTTPMVVEDFDS
jgi:hypothetical protein